MWLKLLSFNATTRETTEICSLEPAFLGVLCDMSAVEDAIKKHLRLQNIELGLSAATLSFFNDKPTANMVASIAYRKVGEEAYCGTEFFVVVWE